MQQFIYKLRGGKNLFYAANIPNVGLNFVGEDCIVNLSLE